MNNNNPIQKLQMLLNNLSNYINQVNSIIIEMNNIFNQINNFSYNQINQNLFQGFNNNNNNNFNVNNFIMNLENQQNYKNKINVVFDVKICDEEIKKHSVLNKINIAIDSDTSINKLLTTFFERIGQGNNINKIKNNFIFLINGNKIDFNEQKSIINKFNYFGPPFNIFVNQIK